MCSEWSSCGAISTSPGRTRCSTSRTSEDFNQHLGDIALRAFDLVDARVATCIERALREPSLSLAEQQQGRPFEFVRLAYAAGLASTASRLGYATRVAEFEQVAEPDFNPHVAEFIEQAAEPSGAGPDWFGAVCRTARVMLRAAHKEPYSFDTAILLVPVGLGHEAHRDLCAWELGARIEGPEAEEAMKEVSGYELADCWGYGYYLRACEMSLPKAAGATLEG